MPTCGQVVKALILLYFPKMGCALCCGIGAMRAGVVGASRCATRVERVERRNKFRPTGVGFGGGCGEKVGIP